MALWQIRACVQYVKNLHIVKSFHTYHKPFEYQDHSRMLLLEE
jgi:hypothetical protein